MQQSSYKVLAGVLAVIAIFLIITLTKNDPIPSDQSAAATNYNSKAASKANPKALSKANQNSALINCPPPAAIPYGVIRPSPTNPGPQNIPFGTNQFTVLEFEVEAYDFTQGNNCAITLDTIAGSVQYLGNSVPAGTPQLVTNYKLYNVTSGYPGTFIPSSPPRCMDGADNDLDGNTDFPADTECSFPEDEDESSLLASGGFGIPFTFHPYGPYNGVFMNPGPANKKKFAIKADVGAPVPPCTYLSSPCWPWDSGTQFTMGVGGEAKDPDCAPFEACPFINMDTQPINSSVITFY